MCSTFPSNNTLCLTNSKTVYCLVCLFSCCCCCCCSFVLFSFFFCFLFFFFCLLLFCFVFLFFSDFLGLGFCLFCLVCLASSFFPPFFQRLLLCFLGGRGGLVGCFVFSNSVAYRSMIPLLSLPFFSFFLSNALSIFFFFFFLVAV